MLWRGVSSMMASGMGLAELCPTSVGPKTRDRLRTSILQSGLRDTLRGADRGSVLPGPAIPSPGDPVAIGRREVGAEPPEPLT